MMIVLVGLRVNHDRIVDAGTIHAVQQKLGRGCGLRLIRAAGMIRETGIARTGKAMQMGIHHDRVLRGQAIFGKQNGGPRNHRQTSQSAGHTQPSTPVALMAAGIASVGLGHRIGFLQA